MNRTIKEATVKRYHYQIAPQQLEAHHNLSDTAYNFGRRLKTLKGLTRVRVYLQKLDDRTRKVRTDPIHQMPRIEQRVRPVSC